MCMNVSTESGQLQAKKKEAKYGIYEKKNYDPMKCRKKKKKKPNIEMKYIENEKKTIDKNKNEQNYIEQTRNEKI